MNLHLSQEALANLETIHKSTSSSRVFKKTLVLLSIYEGHSLALVAKMFRIHISTLYRYVEAYLQEGICSITTSKHVAKQPFLTPAQEKALAEEVQKNLYTHVGDVVRWVREKFDVSYSPSGLRKVLHRLGFVYKKTKSVPAKADAAAQAQAAFLAELKVLKAGKKKQTVYSTTLTVFILPITRAVCTCGRKKERRRRYLRIVAETG